MPKYFYQARTYSGILTKGFIESPDERLAREKLRAEKLIILSLTIAKPNILDEILKKIPFLKPKVKLKELSIFSRQLSTMVTAGVPIVEGLDVLKEQTDNKYLKKVISEVKTDVEAGMAISHALKKHPDVFSSLYVSMIEAGEVGGRLDEILDRLSSYLEKAEALAGKIKSAMTYPAFVATFAIGVLIFMLTSIIPKFASMFQEIGATLPELTLIILDLSKFIKKNLFFIIAGIVALITIVKQLRAKNEKFRYFLDGQLLKITLFGPLIKKISISKFTRTFATLVKSGVPILQCMEVVAKTSGNLVIEKAILKARDSIKEGEKISTPLKNTGVFPPMVTQMIAIGEETGNLDEMLTKISEFYEREVDEAVSALTSAMEPLIIIILGAAVGAMVVSMFLPMFELVSKVSAM